MERAVAKDGKVRIVYKDWPIFGERSERAARVAIASAYQGVYPRVHRAMMSGKRLDQPTLRQAVEQSGADWSRLENDLRLHRKEIDERLAKNAQQAFALGLGGTPGYLVGPILIRGGVSEADFTRAITKARSQN